MKTILARKLAGFAELSDADHVRLVALSSDTIRREAGSTLVLEGDRPGNVFLLLDGWAFRYKILEDGGRQIVGFMIPGDLCDIHIFILKQMDHSIGLLSNATLASIPKDRLLKVMDESPAISRALWWASLVDSAIAREWLVSAGRRDAYPRVAHLFCELWLRLRQVGLAGDGAFNVPLTQVELADTVGLTPVHINRVLKRMRGEGLITLTGKQLEIHDIDRLKDIAGFDANYLHLEGAKVAAIPTE